MSLRSMPCYKSLQEIPFCCFYLSARSLGCFQKENRYCRTDSQTQKEKKNLIFLFCCCILYNVSLASNFYFFTLFIPRENDQTIMSYMTKDQLGNFAAFFSQKKKHTINKCLFQKTI